MQNSRLKGQIAARMKQKCTMKPNTILSRKGTIISGKMDEAAELTLLVGNVV